MKFFHYSFTPDAPAHNYQIFLVYLLLQLDSLKNVAEIIWTGFRLLTGDQIEWDHVNVVRCS